MKKTELIKRIEELVNQLDSPHALEHQGYKQAIEDVKLLIEKYL